MLKRRVLESPAWRALTIHARRFLDLLMLDLLAHGGTNNGELIATYDQAVKYGISRKSVHPAIVEVVNAGLVLITRQGGKNLPTCYALAWLPIDPHGRRGSR